MSIIQRLGRGLLMAAVTPLCVAEEIRTVIGMRGELDTLRDAVARLAGELDEARRLEERARRDSADAVVSCRRTAKEFEEASRVCGELRSDIGKVQRALGEERSAHAKTQDRLKEAQAHQGTWSAKEVEIRRALSCGDYVDIVKAVESHVAALVEAQESNRRRDDTRARAVADAQTARAKLDDEVERRMALGAELHDAKRAAVELQGEVDKVRKERDAAEVAGQMLADRIHALETQLDARADVAPAVEPCAWCLGPLGKRPARLDLSTDASEPEQLALVCRECWELPDVYTDDVRLRSEARADSCKTRRTSPDPLAVACTLGCGAMRGEPCSAETFLESPVAPA